MTKLIEKSAIFSLEMSNSGARIAVFGVSSDFAIPAWKVVFFSWKWQKSEKNGVFFDFGAFFCRKRRISGENRVVTWVWQLL